jgi:hypothetical protein
MIQYWSTQCNSIFAFEASCIDGNSLRVCGSVQSTSTVQETRWCYAFGNGRTDVDNKQQPWRPTTSTIDKNFVSYRCPNQEGQTKSTDTTQELDISLRSAHSTVHNKQNYRKVCAWLPNNLTQNHKAFMWKSLSCNWHITLTNKSIFCSVVTQSKT